MNRRFTHRRTTVIFAAAISAALMLLAVNLWAAPPTPEPAEPDEDTIIIDDETVRLGEDYLDLVKELEGVLADFNEFYQETGQASLAGIARAAKSLQKSLKEDAPQITNDELVRKLDEVIDKMDRVIEDAESDKSQLKRRHLRELQSFSEDLSDIRDEFESDFSAGEFKALVDPERLAKIIENATRAAEKAMKMAVIQQKNLDSQLIIPPPVPAVPPAPATGRIQYLGQAKNKYYLARDRHDYDDSLTQTATMTVPSREAKIKVENAIGGIEIRTWNRSETVANLTIGFASGSNSSRSTAKDIRLTASSTDRGLVFQVEYPDDESNTVGIVSSQLVVTVPAANPVDLENSFGPVTVADLRNGLTVSSNFGSVEAKRITGDVSISSSTGSVYVEEVTGKLDVANSFGDIEVIEANGPTSLSNSYASISIRNSSGLLDIANSGAVAVTGHKGNVSLQSSNGEVELYKITGDLQATNSFGGMQIESVSGEVKAENSSAALEIADIGGPLQATNRFGSIEISDARGNIRAESSNSEISVERAAGEVKIINRFGKVTVKDAGGAVQIDNSNAVVDITGVRGDALITNQFAPVIVANVTGAVEIDNQNASVDLNDIGGTVTVHTTFGAVSGKNLKGPFSIDNDNGSVELSRLAAISKDCEVRATSGDITVKLPSAGGFNVDASTSWGKIQTDLPMKISSGGNITSGEYTAGSGYPTLTLKGENASIIISTRP
jgi:hypothetical protein